MYTMQAKIYEILWHKLKSALPCLSGKAVLSCTPVISDAMTMVNGLITHACNRPISNLYITLAKVKSELTWEFF